MNVKFGPRPKLWLDVTAVMHHHEFVFCVFFMHLRVCVTVLCLMFTSVNDIYFSLFVHDTVKLADFFLPLLHTRTKGDRDKGRQTKGDDRVFIFCDFKASLVCRCLDCSWENWKFN